MYKQWKCTLNSASYNKMLLHAVKYPYYPVNGTSTKTSLDVTDSVPLFHSPVLAPILEVAFSQIEEYAKSKDLAIVGYYHASAKAKDEDALKVAQQVGSRIHSRCEAATLFVMDNTKVMEPESIAGEFYSFTDKGQPVANTKNVTLPDDIFSSLSKHIKASTSVKLQDFDNHLDTLTNDWRNLDLLK